MYLLFGRQSSIEEDREGERNLASTGSLSLAITARDKPGQTQEPGTSFTWISFVSGKGPSIWVSLCSFPQAISGELAWKWSSQ